MVVEAAKRKREGIVVEGLCGGKNRVVGVESDKDEAVGATIFRSPNSIQC